MDVKPPLRVLARAVALAVLAMGASLRPEVASAQGGAALTIEGCAGADHAAFDAAAALERGLALLEQGHRLPLLAADLAYQLAETRAAGQDWRGAELALVQAMPPEMQATPAYSFFRLRKTLLHALVMVRLGRGEAGWAEASEAARVMVERLSDPHLPQSSRVTMQAVYRTAFARVVDIAVATGHLEEAFSAAQWTALSELSVSGQMLAAGRAAADPAARAPGMGGPSPGSPSACCWPA